MEDYKLKRSKELDGYYVIPSMGKRIEVSKPPVSAWTDNGIQLQIHDDDDDSEYINLTRDAMEDLIHILSDIHKSSW